MPVLALALSRTQTFSYLNKKKKKKEKTRSDGIVYIYRILTQKRRSKKKKSKWYMLVSQVRKVGHQLLQSESYHIIWYESLSKYSTASSALLPQHMIWQVVIGHRTMTTGFLLQPKELRCAHTHLFFRGGTHFKYIIILFPLILILKKKKTIQTKQNSLRKIKKNLNRSFSPKKIL